MMTAALGWEKSEATAAPAPRPIRTDKSGSEAPCLSILLAYLSAARGTPSKRV